MNRHKRRIEGDEGNGGNGKGKGKSAVEDISEENGKGAEALVIFACRHLWHRRCLEKAAEVDEEGEGTGALGSNAKGKDFKCPICV